MAMPRPTGKPLAIAKKVVPFLKNKKSRNTAGYEKREVPNDEVEMKIVRINENRGKL